MLCWKIDRAVLAALGLVLIPTGCGESEQSTTPGVQPPSPAANLGAAPVPGTVIPNDGTVIPSDGTVIPNDGTSAGEPSEANPPAPAEAVAPAASPPVAGQVEPAVPAPQDMPTEAVPPANVTPPPTNPVVTMPVVPPMPGEPAVPEPAIPTQLRGSLEFERLIVHGKNWSEGITIADINQDGNNDIASGPLWFAGPTFEVAHEYFENPATKDDPDAEWSKTGGSQADWADFSWDINGDTWPDIIIINRPGNSAYWYENPGAQTVNRPDTQWERHLIAKGVQGEHTGFINLVGDEMPEIITNIGGTRGYLQPNAGDATREWRWQAVTRGSKRKTFSHGLGAGDVDGDGRMDLLEANGYWRQPDSPDSDWREHKVQFKGNGADGGSTMFAYDIDDDGDNDVVSVLNAHGWGLAWFEQTNDGFEEHRLMGSDREKDRFGGMAISQLHALVVEDMDRDGVLDFVTGKTFYAHAPGKGDPGTLDTPYFHVWRLTRDNDEAKFVPHLVDSEQGLGRQFTVGDMNNDSLPDIVVGNKNGVSVYIQKPLQ